MTSDRITGRGHKKKKAKDKSALQEKGLQVEVFELPLEVGLHEAPRDVQVIFEQELLQFPHGEG